MIIAVVSVFLLTAGNCGETASEDPRFEDAVEAPNAFEQDDRAFPEETAAPEDTVVTEEPSGDRDAQDGAAPQHTFLALIPIEGSLGAVDEGIILFTDDDRTGVPIDAIAIPVGQEVLLVMDNIDMTLESDPGMITLTGPMTLDDGRNAITLRAEQPLIVDDVFGPRIEDVYGPDHGLDLYAAYFEYPDSPDANVSVSEPLVLHLPEHTEFFDSDTGTLDTSLTEETIGAPPPPIPVEARSLTGDTIIGNYVTLTTALRGVASGSSDDLRFMARDVGADDVAVIEALGGSTAVLTVFVPGELTGPTTHAELTLTGPDGPVAGERFFVNSDGEEITREEFLEQQGARWGYRFVFSAWEPATFLLTVSEVLDTHAGTITHTGRVAVQFVEFDALMEKTNAIEPGSDPRDGTVLVP
ncbi:MAG: hypothetical protein R3290_03105 [Acidimicrobiia bacterium]|nr:hypothetical protein [Acidimicrobiia bacterium]